MSQSSLAAPERVALVIGNADYTNANKLPNDLNDATDMATVLKQYGFKVTVLKNGTLKDTIKALKQFQSKLRGAKVGLFYYSGHGVEIDGNQYAIPVDLPAVESEDELSRASINITDVLKYVEGQADLNLIILDACRSDPFQDKGFGASIKALGGSKGFNQIKTNARGSLIASATNRGNISDGEGGNGRNSVYTEHLLSVLKNTPKKEVRLLLGDVGEKVQTATVGRQQPWTNTSMTGEFYFDIDTQKAYDTQREKEESDQEQPTSNSTEQPSSK